MRDAIASRGWAAPVNVSASGVIAMVDGYAELDQSILLIIGTELGERPLRPDFGCGISAYVFEAPNPATCASISREVKRAVERWEPRVVLDDVTATPSRDRNDVISVDIVYSAVALGGTRSLAVPYCGLTGRLGPIAGYLGKV